MNKINPETLSNLYQTLAHGSDAHRAWLREAMNNWNEDKRSPPPYEEAPLPVLLTCPIPTCGARHIDKGVFATKVHHTHSCQSCGHTWRPAVAPTVGVQFLPGFKDE